MSHSQLFAARLLASLCEHGVRSFYLAPGSRSQALAIAANQLAEAGLADLTVRLDERSMGFMALGRALTEKRPVVVITTSGTAVANLHPAVLEAHHSGVPLILLTADRPAKLRGKGANQTTNQVGIFSDAIRELIDVSVPESAQFDPKQLAERAVRTAIGFDQADRPGPVQLNLQFQEPLSSSEPNAATFVVKEPHLPEADIFSSQLEVKISPKAIVVAGSGAGQTAVDFAQKANLPVLAEPSSGARFGANLSVTYPQLLETELATEIDQVFVFGKPTLSRSVLRVISGSETWVQFSREHGHFDVFGNVAGFADQLIPLGTAPSSWLERWRFSPEGLSNRAKLAKLIWEATSEGEQLVFGASQIIRDAQGALPPKRLDVFSNRGLAGIDGTVATALGLAQSGKKTRAVMGDLTLLHDASSLNVSGLGPLDVQLIVGNDHGGQIFKHLEVAQTISEKDLTKLFLTPQSVNLESLALAYGWNYRSVASLEELEPLLSETGLWLIDYQL